MRPRPRIARQGGLAALPVLAMLGCSEPAPPVAPRATVQLSAENPDANAPVIAAFFRRTCLDASGDRTALEAALHDSGWGYERTGVAGPVNPVDGWRLEQGRLYYSLVEIGPGVRAIDCHVEVDGAVAPSVERMRAALRPLLSHDSLREVRGTPPDVRWQWRPGSGEDRDLTVGALDARPSRNSAGGRVGIAIHLATTPVDLERGQAPE